MILSTYVKSTVDRLFKNYNNFLFQIFYQNYFIHIVLLDIIL